MMLLLLLSLLPPPVGREARRGYPPLAPPSPGLSSTRLPSSHQESEACRHFWLRPLWPFSLSLYGGESEEGSGVVSVFVLPLGIAPAPLLESVEVEVRVLASSLESDETATVTWSDLAALALPPRLWNHQTSTPALAIFIANAPVMNETRASIAHAILGNAPSTARGLGSAPTAPELLRSEAVSRDALTRAAHRFLREEAFWTQCSALHDPQCYVKLQKSLDAFEGDTSHSSSAALSLVGPRRLERATSEECVLSAPQWSFLAPALALPPVMKSVRRERDALSGDQTAPLVIVASHPPKEGAAVLLLSFLFLGVIMSRSHPSDSLSNEADGGSKIRATDQPTYVTPGADANRAEFTHL